MKKIFLFAASFVVIIAGCKKEPVPEIIPIVSEIETNEIRYVSTDGKAHAPVSIDGFDAGYISTAYFGDYGVIYFDAPVKVIGENAFKGAKCFKSFSFTNQLDKIDVAAFRDCENLESINFGYSVKEISESAFEGCKALRKIKFPTELGAIGVHAFKDCEALGSMDLALIKIGEIGDGAFEGCRSLSEVKLPYSIQKIGHRIFDQCAKLRYITPELGALGYPTVCEDSFETGSCLFLRVDFARYQEYKKNMAPIARHLLIVDGVGSINSSNWTEYMPESIPLNLLTVPCCHDAATWMCAWFPLAMMTVKKDQNLNYKECWNCGARLFDMRLGYDNNPQIADFEDRCCFYHGAESDYFCQCHTYKEDIKYYFPDPSWVDKSFMILEAQLESNDEPDKNLNIFEYFMRLLIEKYGADRFIAYHPSLTLGDIKGKILLFATTKDFTENYYHIGHTPQVPINYRTGEYIEPFVDGRSTGNKFPIEVQNKYEVEDSDEKYNVIREGLKKPVGNLFFNGFNATLADWPHPSWPISRHINRKIVDDLAKKPTEDIYNRPLGLVYFDFCGYETLSDPELLFIPVDFAGETLVRLLVEQNFKDVY